MNIGPRTLSALMDRGIVHDYADEYGEPGYSSDGPVVLGSWWCEDRNCGHPVDEHGRRKLHAVDVHFPRLMAALERDASMEWYDEWMVDNESAPTRAYRTSPDSYGWQPAVVLDDDCEWLTPDSGPAAWIAWAKNTPSRALMREYPTADDLDAAGFTEHACGYEAGWHPGQDADPAAIDRAAREQFGPEIDTLFRITSVGQFDLSFCLYVRDESADEIDENA